MSRSVSLCSHVSLFDHVEACFASRDYQVLQAFAQYRYLTSGHVQRLLFYNHDSSAISNRTCRRALTRLTHKGLLKCLERRIGGSSAGSGASIYCLTPAGGRLLANMGLIERRANVRASVTFLEHTLSIAEAAIRLSESARAGSFELLTLATEPKCWRTFLSMYGTNEYLKPDLHAVTATREHEHHFFIEIDLGTESLPRIVRKCHQYTAYWQSGTEQEQVAIFPYVVWVAPNKTRAARMAHAIANASGPRQELFSVITPSEFLDVMRAGPFPF